ncbi:DUF695 domain-containing protein [Lysobacter sp. HA35]
MESTTVTIEVPDPHYTLFNATREGLPEVVSVNDALLAFRHIEIFPWHLEVTIEAHELADQGMPTPEESHLLFEIADEIEAEVVGYNALFLARSTWNGLRQLLFQVHDPEVAHQALQALLNSRKHERPWEYRMHHDPSWTDAGYVFKLFPLASRPGA